MTGSLKHSVLFVLGLMLVAPTYAEDSREVKQLKAQLAAQKEINALMKQRIVTLEAELEGRKIPPPQAARDAPAYDAGDPEEERALERTLVRRGSAVLPPGVVELSPSLVWSHAAGGFMASAQNIYGFGLDARVGLKDGWMIGASVPLLHRDAPGGGQNTGLGDISVTVWKSLLRQTDILPSIVASARYTAPTGADFGSATVPLGNGFHTVQGRLSFAKSAAPVVFFGDLSYTAFLGETIRGIDLDRDGIYGIGLGASLAVTPDISMTAGVNFSFEDPLAVNGVRIPGTSETQGAIELGVGIIISRGVFLTFSGAFGITPDSPDATLGVALPMRF